MFKPLNNRILVRPDPVETTTAGGIVLPDSVSKEAPRTGTVVVGGESVKEGDHILFSRYGFDEFKQDNETLYVVSEPTILAIL